MNLARLTYRKRLTALYNTKMRKGITAASKKRAINVTSFALNSVAARADTDYEEFRSRKIKRVS